MCSATMTDCGRDVVVGSSDHALYVVDTFIGVKKRTLYSKTTGHSERVRSLCSAHLSAEARALLSAPLQHRQPACHGPVARPHALSQLKLS